MKKFLTALCGIILVFALTACGSTANASIFASSPWLNTPSDKGVEFTNESTSFSVSFTQAEDSKLKVTVDDTSKYTTKLTKTTYETTVDAEKTTLDCYLYETELNVNGKIVNGDSEVALQDVITTKCYFLGIENNLQPLYSERNVLAHSPVLKSANEYEVNLYDYSLKTNYVLSSNTYGDTAEVTFKKGDKNSENSVYGLEEGTKTYNDIDAQGTFIDNEILFLAMRATTLTSSSSFCSIDAISGINRKMKKTTTTLGESNIVELDNFFFNTKKEASVLCAPVSIAIDSKFPGSAITVAYASESKFRNTMIQIKSEAFYGLGSFTYTANSTMAD